LPGFLVVFSEKSPFRYRIRANLPREVRARRKTRRKITEKVVKNGGKWRFFEDPKRHFAVLGADGARSQTAVLLDHTSVEPSSIEPPPTPPISDRAPFFTAWGTGRHV